MNRSWPRNGRPCWRNIREAEERPRKLCSRRKQADRTPSRNLRMRTGRTGREASLSLLRSLTRKSRRTIPTNGAPGIRRLKNTRKSRNSLPASNIPRNTNIPTKSLSRRKKRPCLLLAQGRKRRDRERSLPTGTTGSRRGNRRKTAGSRNTFPPRSRLRFRRRRSLLPGAITWR